MGGYDHILYGIVAVGIVIGVVVTLGVIGTAYGGTYLSHHLKWVP